MISEAIIKKTLKGRARRVDRGALFPGEKRAVKVKD